VVDRKPDADTIDSYSAPSLKGYTPTQTVLADHRDIKVLRDYAYVVSEARQHGLQIFDLTRLRGSTPNAVFAPDAHFDTFSGAHNIAIDTESETAFVVGSNRCRGGLYMLDLSTPDTPVEAGCYADDGYTHDTQCVVYRGSDHDHLGSEICFSANEDSLTIVNVSNKAAPALIKRVAYAGSRYTHLGWLSDDQRYFFVNDELDELRDGQIDFGRDPECLSAADLTE